MGRKFTLYIPAMKHLPFHYECPVRATGCILGSVNQLPQQLAMQGSRTTKKPQRWHLPKREGVLVCSIRGRTCAFTVLNFGMVLALCLPVSLLCAESFSLTFLDIYEISNIFSIKSFSTKIGQNRFLMFVQ